jgi:hypothetical protein
VINYCIIILYLFIFSFILYYNSFNIYFFLKATSENSESDFYDTDDEDTENNDNNPNNENNLNNDNNPNNEFIRNNCLALIFEACQASSLNCYQFAVIYLKLCNKLKLNKIQRDLILRFISAVLPPNNKIPNSYYKLQSFLNIEKIINKKICSLCYNNLQVVNKLYQCVKCNKQNDGIEITTFDLEAQLRTILHKHKDTIIKYKGKHMRYNVYLRVTKYNIFILTYKAELATNRTSDILSNYVKFGEQNQISLVFFYDGIKFFNSKCGSLHAFLLSVADLPPNLRHSSRNILTQAFVPGTITDIQQFNNTQMTNIDKLLQEGTIFRRISLYIWFKGVHLAPFLLS